MRTLRLSIAVLFLITISTSAFAATLSHSPDYQSISVPAGTQVTMAVSVSIYDMVSDSYTLNFLTSTDGRLPIEWIIPIRTSVTLTTEQSSASNRFTIAVPIGTPPGTYSGRVYSSAVSAYDRADPGNGMFLEVTVPARCTGVPIIEVTTVSPEVIWPPTHNMQMVTLNGAVIMPEGCTFRGAKYRIEDEYGVYSREGGFVLSGTGSFSISLPVEAWRDGQDMDGRVYRITLSALNDAGIGLSKTMEVIVPKKNINNPKAK